MSESFMVNKNKFEDRLCQSGMSLSGGKQVGREVLLRTQDSREGISCRLGMSLGDIAGWTAPDGELPREGPGVSKPSPE